MTISENLTRSVFVAPALSASVNFMQPFPAPRGVRTITLREADAGPFYVGAYVDFEGRIWKVAARRPAEDWTVDEIYVRLHGADYVEGGLFQGLLAKIPTLRAMDERVAWLEDA